MNDQNLSAGKADPAVSDEKFTNPEHLNQLIKTVADLAGQVAALRLEIRNLKTPTVSAGNPILPTHPQIEMKRRVNPTMEELAELVNDGWRIAFEQFTDDMAHFVRLEREKPAEVAPPPAPKTVSQPHPLAPSPISERENVSPTAVLTADFVSDERRQPQTIIFPQAEKAPMEMTFEEARAASNARVRASLESAWAQLQRDRETDPQYQRMQQLINTPLWAKVD